MSSEVQLPVVSRPATAAEVLPGRLRPRAWPWGAVALLATIAVAARLPATGHRLSPDEGGFLMVAGQWAPGSSLYGDYWVDRPPLLVALFQLADLLGGGSSLRLLGDVCVAVSVVLAALLGRAVWRLSGPGRAAAPVPLLVLLAPAATAAALLVSPLSGATEVDGELLAAPFVLAGLLAALSAYLTTRRRLALARWGGAGALVVAAASVKQNMLDVAVALLVLLVVVARRDHRRALGAGLAVLAGGLVAAGAVLGYAALHGTTPAGLWDAVVSFRLQASATIAEVGPETARRRALGVAGAFLASGSGALLLVALLPARRGARTASGPRPAPTVLVLTGAVLAWEAVGVVGGGSYWLHYLVGLVPGLVLVAAVAATYRPSRRRVLVGVLAYAGLVALGGVVATLVQPVAPPGSDVAVEEYLAAHARPGDTGMVAFGAPSILQAAGLPSPYEQLWSLPVRVRDPQLTGLAAVLRGPDRPTWVVVDGESLGTWGVDPTAAEPALSRHYVEVRVFEEWHVLHRVDPAGAPSPGLHPRLPTVAP